ncbi:MAG: NAD(P)/FAD-dependent oxidoreductase, partial [Patescibacteria group bacterium]
SVPITGFLSKGLLEFNDKGEIKVDSKNHCVGTEGLFAAGDVTDVPEKQIVIAAGEGAKASLSAYKYLKS